ncbi:hypothetical protein Lal_00045306 [Lupinus albus]|nr:hypothetical protein Lal_00045306 [Lupinus albus]
MGKSTRETLYPETRSSARLTARGVSPDGAEPSTPDYPMIEALRAAREQGYDALTAAERYDPDFSIDLSRCQTAKEADASWSGGTSTAWQSSMKRALRSARSGKRTGPKTTRAARRRLAECALSPSRPFGPSDARCRLAPAGSRHHEPRRHSRRHGAVRRGQRRDRGADRRPADQVRDGQGLRRPDGRPVPPYLHALSRELRVHPNTLSEDGDPCDVLVANTRAIQPGAVLAVRPVGVLLMEDEHGPDEKIIGVPAARLTRRYDGVQAYTDLPEITRQQIRHFFEHYKDLEPGKWVRIAGWADAAEARTLIAAAEARHQHQLTCARTRRSR